MLRRFICFAIFPLVLAIQGCGGAGLPVVPPDPTIRYVNASPNSGTVDFFLDGDVVGSALPYLGSTANFASRTPGDQELSVAITGDPEAQWTEAIAPERDKHYVAVAFGLRTPPNTELAKRMRIGILTADRARPNNGARLIVFHAYS